MLTFEQLFGFLLAAMLIDVLVFFMLFRLQSRIPVGNGTVLRGALLGAVGFAVLKYLGAEFASGMGSHPGRFLAS